MEFPPWRKWLRAKQNPKDNSYAIKLENTQARLKKYGRNKRKAKVKPVKSLMCLNMLIGDLRMIDSHRK